MLAILFSLFSLFAPKDFWIVWLTNLLIMSIPDECYSNLLIMSIPDECYSNLLIMSVPDECYSNLLIERT
jgi:hypothetical protein